MRQRARRIIEKEKQCDMMRSKRPSLPVSRPRWGGLGVWAPTPCNEMFECPRQEFQAKKMSTKTDEKERVPQKKEEEREFSTQRGVGTKCPPT